VHAQADFASDKAAFDSKAEEVRKTDDLLSSLTTGVSSGDGETGYMEQLQGACRATPEGKRMSHTDALVPSLWYIAPTAAKNRVGQVASETKQAQLKACGRSQMRRERLCSMLTWPCHTS